MRVPDTRGVHDALRRRRELHAAATKRSRPSGGMSMSSEIRAQPSRLADIQMKIGRRGEETFIPFLGYFSLKDGFRLPCIFLESLVLHYLDVL